MKVRQSVKAANWSKTREEWYKKECDEILYSRKSEILLENNSVFIITDNQKLYLMTIDNAKTKWFQIWLKLMADK